MSSAGVEWIAIVVALHAFGCGIRNCLCCVNQFEFCKTDRTMLVRVGGVYFFSYLLHILKKYYEKKKY